MNLVKNGNNSFHLLLILWSCIAWQNVSLYLDYLAWYLWNVVVSKIVKLDFLVFKLINCLLLFVPFENISLTWEVTIAGERASKLSHKIHINNLLLRQTHCFKLWKKNQSKRVLRYDTSRSLSSNGLAILVCSVLGNLTYRRSGSIDRFVFYPVM